MSVIPTENRAAADQLNRGCFCVTLDREALATSLQNEADDDAFYELFIKSRPHLFSHAPVFLPKADGDAMQAIVHAIEAVTRLPQYQQAALAHSFCTAQDLWQLDRARLNETATAADRP